MKFSVYLSQGQGSKRTEHFLQSSDRLEAVKRDKGSLDRWISEMGIALIHHKSAVYTIFENGQPVYTRHQLGAGSKSWVKVAPTPKPKFFLNADLELVYSLSLAVGDHLFLSGDNTLIQSVITIHSAVGKRWRVQSSSGLDLVVNLDDGTMRLPGAGTLLRVVFHASREEFKRRLLADWLPLVLEKAQELEQKALV
jgi:hypothetical protein